MELEKEKHLIKIINLMMGSIVYMCLILSCLLGMLFTIYAFIELGLTRQNPLNLIILGQFICVMLFSYEYFKLYEKKDNKNKRRKV